MFWQVVFTLIVFRPYVGEVIIGKVKESDENGLRSMLISLFFQTFFQNVYFSVKNCFPLI